jgi:hypothetical protein
LDLKSFLEKTRYFREARPIDNEAILSFFDQSEMRTGDSRPGGMRLRYERSPDFFRFLSFQGNKSHVFIGSEESSIDFVCSLTLREAHGSEGVTQVGYLGDLRVHSSPRLTVAWRKTYGELLRRRHEVTELRSCEGFLTAILRDNLAASHALVTPRKDLGYRYDALCDYRMVTLLGRWPGGLNTSPLAEWKNAQPGDQSELIEFLDRCGRSRPWGFVAPSEFTHRLRTWPGFSVSSFWIAREQTRGRVIGAFAPWSPSPHKRILVEKLPRSLALALRPFRWLGLPIPAPGEELRVQYLTWLELDPALSLRMRQELFRAGLNAYWRSPSRPRSSLLAFCDFDSETLSPGLPQYLKTETKLTLFQVVASSEPLPSAGAFGPGCRPPGFEMALV